MWFSCSQIFLNYLTVNSFEGPGWLNELGSRNTQQLIQAYYQYGFVNCKNGAFDSAPSNEAYQLFAHGRWFYPVTPTSSTTKTGCHDIAENGAKTPKIKSKSNHI
jgi:hypothetical protein